MGRVALGQACVGRSGTRTGLRWAVALRQVCDGQSGTGTVFSQYVGFPLSLVRVHLDTTVVRMTSVGTFHQIAASSDIEVP
jgi:hypothetical protein